MSARCVRISSPAQRNWASRSASSSTTCTTGVTFWWMTCSAPNTDPSGPQQDLHSRPGNGSPSTTTVPSPPPIRYETCRTPSPGFRPAVASSHPRNGSPWTPPCAPIRSTPLGSCSAKITSVHLSRRLRGFGCAVGKSPRRRAGRAGRHHGARHRPGGPDGVRGPERDRLIGRRGQDCCPPCSSSEDRCENGNDAGWSQSSVWTSSTTWAIACFAQAVICSFVSR